MDLPEHSPENPTCSRGVFYGRVKIFFEFLFCNNTCLARSAWRRGAWRGVPGAGRRARARARAQVQGAGCRVQGAGAGAGCRVQGAGRRAQGYFPAN
jgi:hypothetical protein